MQNTKSSGLFDSNNLYYITLHRIPLHYMTWHVLHIFYCIFSVAHFIVPYENRLMSFGHYDKLFQETHLSILLLYKQKLLLLDKTRIQPGTIDEHSDKKKV